MRAFTDTTKYSFAGGESIRSSLEMSQRSKPKLKSQENIQLLSPRIDRLASCKNIIVPRSQTLSLPPPPLSLWPNGHFRGHTQRRPLGLRRWELSASWYQLKANILQIPLDFNGELWILLFALVLLHERSMISPYRIISGAKRRP